MEDLGTCSVPSLPRIPLFPQLELLMKDYEFWAYQGYPPPPWNLSRRTVQGTGVWRLSLYPPRIGYRLKYTVCIIMYQSLVSTLTFWAPRCGGTGAMSPKQHSWSRCSRTTWTMAPWLKAQGSSWTNDANNWIISCNPKLTKLIYTYFHDLYVVSIISWLLTDKPIFSLSEILQLLTAKTMQSLLRTLSWAECFTLYTNIYFPASNNAKMFLICLVQIAEDECVFSFQVDLRPEGASLSKISRSERIPHAGSYLLLL